MEAKLVNLDEWESFGGGAFGESFYNKKDDSVILKLNRPDIPESKILQEFVRSKAVYDMGIPSAEPYEFVTDGKRYGMIVQRIQGKQSFGSIIADHPDRLEELACITADFAKALHAIPCDTSIFYSRSQLTRDLIAACPRLPDKIKTRLIGYIDELEPATTCLHGDINPCNIITAEGKLYWIDLGDFAYGDPLLDFSIMSHISFYGPNPLLLRFFHMNRKQMIRFYEVMGRQYFGPVWDTPEHREKMRRITSIMAGKAICDFPSASHINMPYLKGQKLLTKINLFLGDRINK